MAAGWENLTLIDGSIGIQASRWKRANEWLIEHSNNFAIGYENIAVDGVGVGVGVIDGGKDRGAEVAVFKSGFTPDPFLTFGDEPRAGR